jgi:3D (Asp-Asp-Asp) domain-containing protein
LVIALLIITYHFIMFPKSFLTALSLLSLGALCSCSTNLTESVVAVKTRAMALVGGSFSTPKNFLPEPASSNTISKASGLPKDKHGMPTYVSHSDRTRYVRTTSYSHMENEPGAYGMINASGSILKYGSVRSAAADWSVYPLGTKFRIKGQPHIYVVDDYGSSLAATNTIDIYKPSLHYMKTWGTRNTEITVIQWGSYERSARLLKGRINHDHCRHMYYNCQRKLNSRLVSSDIKRNGAL